MAAGDSILHLGFFIATLYLPKNVKCYPGGVPKTEDDYKNVADYGNTISLLCLSHAVNSSRFIVKFIGETIAGVRPEWRFGTTFAEKLWRIFGVFFQMWAILQAQDIFFFYTNEGTCTEELVG